MEKKKFVKASYNPDMDRIIQERIIDLGGATVLNMSVRSYSDGPIKLQIVRMKKAPEGKISYSKLGRISREEAVAISQLLAEMIGYMEQ